MMNQPISFVAQKLSGYYTTLPHCRAIQLTMVSFVDDIPTFMVPFQDTLQVSPHEKIMHGGIVTTLIDVTAASAVTTKMPELEGLATIDMRVDHIQKPHANQAIFCQAHCYNEEGDIAYVRAHCYQEDHHNPFTIATATFIRTKLTPEQKALLA